MAGSMASSSRSFARRQPGAAAAAVVLWPVLVALLLLLLLHAPASVHAQAEVEVATSLQLLRAVQDAGVSSIYVAQDVALSGDEWNAGEQQRGGGGGAGGRPAGTSATIVHRGGGGQASESACCARVQPQGTARRSEGGGVPQRWHVVRRSFAAGEHGLAAVRASMLVSCVEW